MPRPPKAGPGKRETARPRQAHWLPRRPGPREAEAESSRPRVKWDRKTRALPKISLGNIEVHHHRLLSAAHHYSFHRLIRAGVHLLMGHVWRHEDEIARPRFLGKLK